MDFTTKPTPSTQAKNPPDALNCAECDRPLLWRGAVCGHCEAKFAQELAEENYRHLLAVQAGEQGQHTCPVCSKCFDQPNIAPTLPAGLPWHLRLNAQGCPHCDTLLEWQPSCKADYFLRPLRGVNISVSIFFGQLGHEFVFGLNNHFWQRILFVVLLALWLLPFSTDRLDKGSWVVKSAINSIQLLANTSCGLLAIAAILGLLIVERASFTGFVCFVGLLIFIAAITATNLILWHRDYLRRRVTPKPTGE